MTIRTGGLAPLLSGIVLMLHPVSGQAVTRFSEAVTFQGALVSEPCTVAAGSDGDNVVVDFGTIAEKTFYAAGSRRTWLQPFHILLKDCDLTLGRSVKITFTGTEDGEQPGLLAVTGSGVGHVAVGLETPAGQALAFNQASEAYTLQTGSTQLDFKAYVQASNEGVKARSVGRGTFEAVSTFALEYP